jgi:glyoxylase-like metal-dependent hydrolase (beta-lactamase superfamily II)
MPNEILLPFPAPPAFGEAIEVADDILWTRFPLQGGLDHVNVYLVRDGNGWAAIDTGMGTPATRDLWEGLLAGPLRGDALTRVIVTHSHPDHVGAAGWMCRRYGVPLYMTFLEYMVCRGIAADPGILEGPGFASYYAAHGLDPAVATSIMARGDGFGTTFTGLPGQFVRLVGGDTLTIGRRRFAVIGAGGHAPEQALLHDREGGVLLVADQVLLQITPNISVYAIDPDGNPLGTYLRSLASLAAAIPSGTLVLPGHHAPFTGLPTRIDEIRAHHAERCELVLAACADTPLTVAELVPVLFPHVTQTFQRGFAFSEAKAHVNYLRALGTVTDAMASDGLVRTATAVARGQWHDAHRDETV